jgi:hypothetical protein
LKGRYGEHKLAAAYRLKLKPRTQVSAETLQEFAEAVEQLTNAALVGLSENFMQRETTYAFVNGVTNKT